MSKFCRFKKKVSLLHKEASEIKSIKHKHWCRKFNGYPHGSIFLFKGNLTLRFNYPNDTLEKVQKRTEVLFISHVKVFLEDKNNIQMLPEKEI